MNKSSKNMNLPDKMNDLAERLVFEKAYLKMKEEGTNSIMISSTLMKKRKKIRDRMISYYEKTEEFEKCRFLKNFFDSIESEIKSSSITSILSSLKKKKEH